MPLKIWHKLTEKIISRNDYWTYKFDEYSIGDELKGEYHYVHTLGSTMVVPEISPNKFLLVKQFRYLNQKESIEFPSGGVIKGLSISENIMKELREETKYAAKNLTKIGEFNPFNGVTDELCHVFYADNLFPSPLPNDVMEEFELLILDFNEIEEMIALNKIWDGMTMAAWSLFKGMKK